MITTIIDDESQAGVGGGVVAVVVVWLEASEIESTPRFVLTAVIV